MLAYSTAVESKTKLLSQLNTRDYGVGMFNELSNSRIRERNRSLSQYSSSLVEDHILYKPIYKLNIEKAYT